MRYTPSHPSRLRILLCLALLPLRLAAADSIDTVEKSAVDWAKIRAETVRLQTEQQSERELLQSTVAALRERVRLLEEKRDSLAAKAGADAREAELTAKSDLARASLRTADARLKVLTEGLVQLRPWLPPRLSKALELPYKSLSDPLLTAGERMQFASTVLNRCAQFNQTVNGGDEALTLEGDSEPHVMEVVYWGLAQAYALDRVSGRAYLGHPGERGWVWDARPDLLDSVAKVMAIYKDKADPEYVELPATLRGPWAPKPGP